MKGDFWRLGRRRKDWCDRLWRFCLAQETFQFPWNLKLNLFLFFLFYKDLKGQLKKWKLRKK